MRVRRQRTLVQEILFDLACIAVVLAGGAIVLYVAFLLRPGAWARPDAPGAPPPTTIAISASRRPTGRWVAWADASPQCTAEAPSEVEAREHVEMAVQLAMRPECETPAYAAAGPPGTGSGLPPPGWYPDPRNEMGETGQRYWNGHAWTADVGIEPPAGGLDATGKCRQDPRWCPPSTNE